MILFLDFDARAKEAMDFTRTGEVLIVDESGAVAGRYLDCECSPRTEWKLRARIDVPRSTLSFGLGSTVSARIGPTTPVAAHVVAFGRGPNE